MTARPTSTQVRVVLEELLRHVDADTLSIARIVGGRDTARRAAVLVEVADADNLIAALELAAVNNPRALGRWLLNMTATVLETPAVSLAIASTVPAPMDELGIDPALAERLPAWERDLLEDVARHLGGLVVAEDAKLAAHDLLGLYDPHATPPTITLAAGLADDELELVLVHEVAHAVDPELESRVHEEREFFAHELAARALTAHPRTVAELLDLAHGAPIPAPTPGARDAELTDLLVWYHAVDGLDLRRARA